MSRGCSTAAQRGTTLPSRGVDAPSRFLTRGSTFHQIEMGTAVILGGALIIVLALVVPVPDITLTDSRFFPAACDAGNGTRTVIATFTLTNRGGGSGALEVGFYADSATLSSDVLFEVPPKTSVRGTLYGVVHDCAPHTYSLSAHYPVYSG